MSGLGSGSTEALGFSPGQKVITSFGADIDLVATCPVPSDGFTPKRPPRHWMVINSGGGNLSYKDHWGNTISAMDCSQLVGIYLPAGPTILTAGTTITKLLVIW